jgi:hypothetical protein
MCVVDILGGVVEFIEQKYVIILEWCELFVKKEKNLGKSHILFSANNYRESRIHSCIAIRLEGCDGNTSISRS